MIGQATITATDAERGEAQPPQAAANPWRALSVSPPYVLESDAPFIELFNAGAAPAQRIDTRLLPEPMFGRHDAPVLVLLLNPGLGERDAAHHRLPKFRSALREHLIAERGAPHFHLLDESHGPGRAWWQRQCRGLIEDVGIEAVARNLLCLEFFPYHSKAFAHSHLRLPSQQFTFALLREAIRRDALVVCMRGLKLWCGAVPETGTHPGLMVPNSPRSAALSAGNLGASQYGRLRAALRAGSR